LGYRQATETIVAAPALCCAFVDLRVFVVIVLDSAVILRRLGKSVIVSQFLKNRKIDSRIGGWRKWWSAFSAVGPRGAKSQTVIQGFPGDWHFPGRSAFGTLPGV
jgi:hypothetical protein